MNISNNMAGMAAYAQINPAQMRNREAFEGSGPDRDGDSDDFGAGKIQAQSSSMVSLTSQLQPKSQFSDAMAAYASLGKPQQGQPMQEMMQMEQMEKVENDRDSDNRRAMQAQMQAQLSTSITAQQSQSIVGQFLNISA